MLMAEAMSSGSGKALIESDRVEGTTIYDPQGASIGTIKRLMIEKINGPRGVCRNELWWISRFG
jgi:hypothetical protein